MKYSKICNNCKKEYICYYDKSRYCSQDCRNKKEGLNFIICPVCKKEFKPLHSKQIHCNIGCYSKSPKLKEKAKNSKMIKENSFKKWRIGKKHTEETKLIISEKIKKEWKNPETTLKKPPIMIGEKNPRWKGDDIDYSPLHSWIRKNKKFTGECDICLLKSNNRRIINAANISGKYKRDIQDYVWLCSKCHKKFDMRCKNNYYEVIAVESKMTGVLDRKEKDMINWYLKNKTFSRFLIASKGEKRGTINYKEIKK